jgi:hypothetical protein
MFHVNSFRFCLQSYEKYCIFAHKFGKKNENNNKTTGNSNNDDGTNNSHRTERQGL